MAAMEQGREVDAAGDPKGAVRPKGTDSAKVIQVIVTEPLEGFGTGNDPCKIKKQ